MKKQFKLFISGTGTDVGKTFITENLIYLLKSKGLTVSPYKPIETGCKKSKVKLIPSDANKFYKLINKEIDIDLINPYRFQQPISPHRAIKLANKKIFIKDYIDKLKLLPKNALYYFTKPNMPRGLDPIILQEEASSYDLKGEIFESVQAALNTAKMDASSEDVIFIGGSTFVVAEVV